MAGNSNSNEHKNNNRNRTPRDHERAAGRTGHAIHARGVSATTDREDVIEHGALGDVAGGGRKPSRDSGHN